MSTPRRPAPRSRPAPTIATGCCPTALSCPRTGRRRRAGAHDPNSGERRRTPKWRGPESNRRHHGFQPCALPTELPRLESSSLAAILFAPPESQTVLVTKAGAPRVDQPAENRLGLLAAPAEGACEVRRRDLAGSLE